VRQLETTDNGSPGEFDRVVDMATRRHTGEVFINRDAVDASVYSGSVYWRQVSSSHYFVTPIPGIHCLFVFFLFSYEFFLLFRHFCMFCIFR